MKLDLSLDESFPQPIDAVWRAITDARLLARWLMNNDFEPRIGHRFTLHEPPTASWGGFVECEVLELDPPRRMVWSWNGGMAGETTTRVVFELHAEGAGTRFRLRHEGEATAAQGESFRSGWSRRVAILSRVLGPDYARRVAFRAPRECAFEAIATIDGLRGWWTPRVSGSAAIGGELRFEFEGLQEHIVMRVDEARRPSTVRWTCVEHTGLPEWGGTRVAFELAVRGGESCDLSFRHEGLTSALDCHDMCAEGWDHFLASLVGHVDAGAGTPFGKRGKQRS